MPHLVATALAGAALAVLPVMPATAEQTADHTTDQTTDHTSDQTAAQRGGVRGQLRLTLTYPGQSTSGTRTVTLRCEPHGGSHPSAAKACAELGRRGGNPAREADDTVCTMIYSPVVASAKGTWGGRPVDFRKEYPNDCVLRSQTGSVFAF
ncbi:SSI family serine proteinase inhibitor [Actinomadura miaoliensis]|uniref:Subtilisin inhibitor domain-containing protein n=1 Tax=Actinomadura miaoliensis TaxID=430685 RepID=A0ABP7VAI5_9ACTN